MIIPERKKIKKLAEDYTVIPLCKEIYADIATPIMLLRKLSGCSKRFFLLESVEGGEKWARYSFLGFNPLLRVSCKERKVTIEREGVNEEFETEDGMEVVRDILSGFKAPKIEGFPPFTGGFVGYFAYAMIAHTEPKLSIKRGEFHDYDLMLFDKVIAYDHLRQKIAVVVNMKTDTVSENYEKAVQEIEEIIDLIQDASPLPQERFTGKVDFKCNVSKEEYHDMIEKTKEYIRDGDIFQAVISRRFVSDFKGSLINPYRILRTTNPSPYMVYMHIDETEIMSTSPETLVRLQSGKLCTFPVAGSRPRGKDDSEDEILIKDLLSDEKELSEHNMLVDLGRNDLGRISKFSSVEVTEYMQIHKYSKIMHICSQVEGQIREEYDALHAVEAVLPAGTLSGAPKVRACEIIEELEEEPRGIYGGALGYIDFSGNLDTCIAIRMAVKKGGKVYVQAGGGIVADSMSELEYEESGNKAKAIIQAIETAAGNGGNL